MPTPNENSKAIDKERCPECATHGRDTSHDNLIIFDDGHKHCFACGHHINGINDLNGSNISKGTVVII